MDGFDMAKDTDQWYAPRNTVIFSGFVKYSAILERLKN
jgi:hypothetical protein